MPIYSYKCSTCGKEEDRLVKFSNADEQLCGCSEGVVIDREQKIYAPSFHLKGSGWYNKGK